METLQNKGRNIGYKAAAVVTSFLPLSVFAQTADPGLEAIEAVGTKVSTYGAGLVALAVVGVGFMVAVKYVKKAPRVS